MRKIDAFENPQYNKNSEVPRNDQTESESASGSSYVNLESKKVGENLKDENVYESVDEKKCRNCIENPIYEG